MERSGEPSVAELQAEQERADEEALNIAQQLRMLETLYALPEFTGDRLDRAAAVGSSALHGYEVAATAGSTAMALILVARSSEQMADSAAA